MQFLLILAICLAFFPELPGSRVADPGWTLAATGVCVLLAGAAAELLSSFLVWQIARNPGNRNKLIRRSQRLRHLHFLACLAGYLLVLFAAGWNTLVRENWGLAGTVLADELLILAPLLIKLAWTWWAFFRVDRALHEQAGLLAGPFWGRGAYVLFHLRSHVALVLAPILIFTAIHDALLYFLPDGDQRTTFELAAIFLLTLAILLVMPWLLTVIWGTRPLPPGPLRARLESTARKLKFRYTDILVWDTRHSVANAMVTGVLRFPRYVLLSDGLIRDLSPVEIEAVFGHEIGHVRHHHMALYMGFLLLSLTLLSGSSAYLVHLASEHDWPWLSRWFGGGHGLIQNWAIYLAAVPVLGAYIYVVFGFLSRRCERQADIYGCKAVSCHHLDCGTLGEIHDPTIQPDRVALCPTGIRTFIRALERVGYLNGIQRDRPSWRHSSIARRVEFLENLSRSPGSERSFQVRLALTKAGLFLLLIGLLVEMSLWESWNAPGGILGGFLKLLEF